MGRIELPTSPLPRECSTTEPHGRILYCYFVCASPGAGEGNRTLVISLEGFCSTIELHPLGFRLSPLGNKRRKHWFPALITSAFWWRRLDSNQRRRKPTDLQSAPFSHSGTPPQRICNYGDVPSPCQHLPRIKYAVFVPAPHQIFDACGKLLISLKIRSAGRSSFHISAHGQTSACAIHPHND